MVEMYRQEELTSLKKELDDLTELFIQIEQTKREDEEQATARYLTRIRKRNINVK